MRTPPPPDLASADIVEALAAGWELEGAVLEYLPVGAGSYHWRATTPDSLRFFVTVDDLGDKPFLGDDPVTVFTRLRRALEAAALMRDEAGLEFVVAPLPNAEGKVLSRIGLHHSVAVYPYLGPPQPVRKPLGAAERTAAAEMVARLHSVPEAVRRHVDAVDPTVPFRPQLEGALQARDEVRADAPAIRGWLARFDELVATLESRPVERVVTHGEPHGGNIVGGRSGFVLVDWDTVGLTAPERDLWLTGGGDPELCELYRLRWRLDDVSWAIRELGSTSGDERARALQRFRSSVDHDVYARLMS